MDAKGVWCESSQWWNRPLRGLWYTEPFLSLLEATLTVVYLYTLCCHANQPLASSLTQKVHPGHPYLESLPCRATHICDLSPLS